MTADLRQLYQEVVIDHGRRPRGFRALEDATRTAEGQNPSCGDALTLYVRLVNGVIEDISFLGVGCAISRASASLMVSAVKGRSAAEALALFGQVHAMLTDGPPGPDELAEMDKLAALSGVWEFPMRVKCATLAWHALRDVLAATGERAPTE